MIAIDAEYKFDVDYTFQYRYRSKSIDWYFKKELFFGFFIFYNSFGIWNEYNDFFRGKENYYQKDDNGDWNLCNIANNVCFGNENYDFKDLAENNFYSIRNTTILSMFGNET